MSGKTIGWVFEHSPFTGATFAVHLAIGDSANDQYDYEIFWRMSGLAAKARVSEGTVRRAVGELIGAGLLEELDSGRQTETDPRPRRFRMLMPARADDASSPKARAGHASTRAGHASSSRRTREPYRTQEGTQEKPKSSAGTADDPRSEIDELCATLAARVGAHRGDDSPPPAVTARWRNDMRLLVDRGPTGQSKPTPTPPERVANAIAYVFDHLADTNGTGFCWADQIRSPGALRRHLPSVRLAAKRVREGSSHGDSSMPAESWPTGGAA
jgi:hypothetical protein